LRTISYRFRISRELDTVRYYMIKAADESELMGVVDYKEYHQLQDELHVYFESKQELEGIEFLNLFIKFQKVGSDCTLIRAKLTYRLVSTHLIDNVRHWMTGRFQLKMIMKGYAFNLKRKIEIWP